MVGKNAPKVKKSGIPKEKLLKYVHKRYKTV